MGRWLGIDFGTRRIGVAICDRDERIASPLRTLDSSGSDSGDARRLLDIAASEETVGIVVGLPLNMDGSDSAQTQRTRQFTQALAAQADIAVELWDERLSSFQADEVLETAGVKRDRRKHLRDTLAARVILQSFLDARHASRAPPAADTGDSQDCNNDL